MQRMRSMAKTTQKKIYPNLHYCQICYCTLKDSYLVKIHQKTHRENQNVSTLKRSLMNELRLQKIYNHFNNEGKFLTIQRILNYLKNKNHVLYKNFKLLQNANLEMFNNFKNKSKFPCINCGECFKNNFELSVHYRNKQCVEDSEKTCSFCLQIRSCFNGNCKIKTIFAYCDSTHLSTPRVPNTPNSRFADLCFKW
jgi:hypothetical protein